MRPPRGLIYWHQQFIIFQINPSQHLKISTRLKIYKEATNDIQRTIKQKNKQYLEKKLSENIAKPNKLRETLKSKGLSISIKCIFEKQKWFIIQITISSGNVLKILLLIHGKLCVKTTKTSEYFNFGIQSLNNYYKNCNVKERLLFAKIESDRVLKIKNFDESKAPDIDNLSGIFLKDGASLITTPITQLCNLSISSSGFPDTCKIAKPKQLFKKGSKADLKNYRPISQLPRMSKVMSKLSNTQK